MLLSFFLSLPFFSLRCEVSKIHRWVYKGKAWDSLTVTGRDRDHFYVSFDLWWTLRTLANYGRLRQCHIDHPALSSPLDERQRASEKREREIVIISYLTPSLHTSHTATLSRLGKIKHIIYPHYLCLLKRKTFLCTKHFEGLFLNTHIRKRHTLFWHQY